MRCLVFGENVSPNEENVSPNEENVSPNEEKRYSFIIYILRY